MSEVAKLEPTANKVDPETAERDFARWADDWDLDIDLENMDEEDAKAFEDTKRCVVRSIQRGALTVDDEGALRFEFRYPKLADIPVITFRVPDGSAMLALDKHKATRTIAKLNGYMGSMTGQNPAIFSKIDGRDLKVCQAIANLFLAG